MTRKDSPFSIAIETSGRTGSVAVHGPDTGVLETVFSGLMKHSAELFTTLDVLLKQADGKPSQIGTVAISAGPGSFTGLRIAVTAAKMFALAQNTKIIAADTMDVIAENAAECKSSSGGFFECIATVLDAKKGYFYAAVFDRTDSGWQKCLPTAMITADDLLKWLEDNKKSNVGILGEGLLYYAKQFHSPRTHILDEQYWAGRASALLRVAERMAAAGQYANPATLIPTYIRKSDAIAKTAR